MALNDITRDGFGPESFSPLSAVATTCNGSSSSSSVSRFLPRDSPALLEIYFTDATAQRGDYSLLLYGRHQQSRGHGERERNSFLSFFLDDMQNDGDNEKSNKFTER